MIGCGAFWSAASLSKAANDVGWRLLNFPLGLGSSPFTEDQLKAAARDTAMQLGRVGGRIVLEVFKGLLDSDDDSYRNHTDATNWQPLVEQFRVWDLLHFS